VLKSLEVWNQTSMHRHAWSLFAKLGSIWVAWVKDNYLRRKSLWSVDIPQNYSWSWRKILKLRDKAKRFLRLEMGKIFIFGWIHDIHLVFYWRIMVIGFYMMHKVEWMPNFLL
jgi:hypothetical protein